MRRLLPQVLATTMAAGVLASGLTASSLAAAATPAAPPTAPAAPAGTNGAAVPVLEWGPCPDEGQGPEPGFDCSTATVPLDYSQPGGATIDLALKRRVADDQAGRIGSLFLNPGGPGGSGVDFVSLAPYVYRPEVLARFDIIGFDPRGVARSAPLICFKTFEDYFTTFAFVPVFPMNRAEERETIDAFAAYTKGCAASQSPVLPHMSTGNAARDLDLLRAAVGDDQLTYAGYSYGTQLGSTYANLFPGNVRALVLDAVVDPIRWTTGEPGAPADRETTFNRTRSDDGSWETLQEFFRLCSAAGSDRCALAASGDPRAAYDRLARQLLREPVYLPLGFSVYQKVGYAELVEVTRQVMYQPAEWGTFAQVLVELSNLRNPDRAAASWQQLQPRLGLDDAAPPEEEVFQTREGLDGVTCLDSDNPSSPWAWPKAGARADRSAPYFGRNWAWVSVACATWPAADSARYTGPWDAETAHPVLIVGNAYDPATPYANAERLATLLPASRLLTLDGYGHTALGQSVCVDVAVGAYLVEGALPADGARCAPDSQPFEAPSDVTTVELRGRQAARQQLVSNIPSVLRQP